MMKIIAIFLMSIIAQVSPLPAESAPVPGQLIDGKLYVEAGTVYVAQNGIFLNFEDNFIPISGVCVDENGIYVIGYDCGRVMRCPHPHCNRIFDLDIQSRKCPHNLKSYPCQAL